MEEAVAALVAAAERNDADAVERIQRAARGDDDALCDAVAAHLRTELEREAPPPLDNTNDFPALPTTKKKRVRATLVTATVPPAPPVATPVKRPSAAASTDASAAVFDYPGFLKLLAQLAFSRANPQAVAALAAISGSATESDKVISSKLIQALLQTLWAREWKLSVMLCKVAEIWALLLMQWVTLWAQ